MAEAERREMRQMQRPMTQPLAIAAPVRAGFRDMPERVGAFVAIRGRVLRAAAADRIEHDEKDAGHGRLVVDPFSPCGRRGPTQSAGVRRESVTGSRRR